jgi:hypothetical protein
VCLHLHLYGSCAVRSCWVLQVEINTLIDGLLNLRACTQPFSSVRTEETGVRDSSLELGRGVTSFNSNAAFCVWLCLICCAASAFGGEMCACLQVGGLPVLSLPLGEGEGITVAPGDF